jgi:hypothetical protein
MATYRIYFLNEHDRINAAQPYELEDDADAIARGRELLKHFPHTDAVEIWQARRFIARISRNLPPRTEH